VSSELDDRGSKILVAGAVKGIRAIAGDPESCRAAYVAFPPSAVECWISRNAMHHYQIRSREDSLDYFYWRSKQYSNYMELPVREYDGKVILHYECGRGHKFFDFFEESKSKTNYAEHVPPVSLAEAAARPVSHARQDIIEFI
jgi:hypothetical protein